MHGQLACSLVSKLGVSPDGLGDEIKTVVVGRADHCWRSHHIFLISRACSLAIELPDTFNVTPFPVTGDRPGRRSTYFAAGCVSDRLLGADCHRSCAPAACVRFSLSRALIMRRLSTVESSLGAAAAIRVACASSGSAFGGTTSNTILLRLRPRISTVWVGLRRYPPRPTGRPPVTRFAASL